MGAGRERPFPSGIPHGERAERRSDMSPSGGRPGGTAPAAAQRGARRSGLVLSLGGGRERRRCSREKWRTENGGTCTHHL